MQRARATAPEGVSKKFMLLTSACTMTGERECRYFMPRAACTAQEMRSDRLRFPVRRAGGESAGREGEQEKKRMEEEITERAGMHLTRAPASPTSAFSP